MKARKFFNITSGKENKKRGSNTRKELEKELNTPRTTIYDNLIKLQKREIVESSTKNTGQIGRPKIYWSIKT